MGLFGQSSPFDADIEKATNEKNTTEPWDLIMDICDKVDSSPRNAKDCLRSVMKRLAHNDPHVVIQAITLLDACVNNCGKTFHLEVASREFENEFKRLLSKAQPQIATKMKLLLKKWAEEEFKSDPQLNLIPSLYQKLKSEGLDFSDSQKATKPASAPPPKDPNVVTSQQEEDDIAKAIELSLKESKASPKKQATSGSAYSSLYPSFSGASSGATGTSSTTSSALPATATQQSEPRKVRALYDFEAAEENELTFAAGEIIHVLDDSDPNWWKGYNQKGEGLFPSNFVTADLSAEPERFDVPKTKETKEDDKTESSERQEAEKYVPEINEEKIDRLLHLLHEANPEDSSQDTEEMLMLEEQVNKMGPLIDTELERVDRKHAQLTQLSSDLVDAINLYHTLMREPERPNMMAGMGMGMPMGYMPGFNQPPTSMYGPSSMYGAGMPNMFPSSMPQMPPHMMPVMPGAPPPTTMQSSNPTPQMPMLGSNPVGSFNPHQPQMIPMQFQNGHPQGMPQQHPPQSQPHQPSLQQNPVAQNQQAPQQQQQPQQQQLPQQPPQHPQMQQQQPQQQQQHIHPPGLQQQQQMHPPQQIPSNPQQMMQQQQHHPPSSQPNQNMIPPHSIANFGPPPPNFGVPPHPAAPQGQFHPQMMHANGPTGGMMPPLPQMSMPVSNHTPLPQMPIINQPVTQTILGQNDSKTNIPIYQQQR